MNKIARIMVLRIAYNKTKTVDTIIDQMCNRKKEWQRKYKIVGEETENGLPCK